MGEQTGNTQNGASGRAQIIIAVISGIVTVLVALIGLAGVIAGLKANSTPTPPFQPSQVNTPTLTATVSIPDIQTPIITATQLEVALTPPTITPTTANVGFGMHVVLTANQTSGIRPLDVRFDARGSYFIAPDGMQFNCGACQYTWEIRKDGATIFGPREEDGSFTYKFQDRGTYYVSVYVCRTGSVTDCNGTVKQITVR